MRLVADLVRGKNVIWASEQLKFMPQRAAHNLKKIVDAALANAMASEGTAKLNTENMHIKKLTVDGGPIARRFRPMGMGRAYRIRKRFCHVTVVISDEQEQTRKKGKKSRARHTA